MFKSNDQTRVDKEKAFYCKERCSWIRRGVFGLPGGSLYHDRLSLQASSKCYFLTVARLFTPEIAAFYEDYYRQRGVEFIKGTVMTSFESDADKKVSLIILS